MPAPQSQENVSNAMHAQAIKQSKQQNGSEISFQPIDTIQNKARCSGSGPWEKQHYNLIVYFVSAIPVSIRMFPWVTELITLCYTVPSAKPNGPANRDNTWKESQSRALKILASVHP